MMLADMGAEVLRLDRIDSGPPKSRHLNPVDRGRRSVAVNLKSPAAREVVCGLADKADILVEGFRPGVMERLGLGPEALMAVNKRLIYGRMTGWGQDGPRAREPGHDINYIAATGALDAIGEAGGAPLPPLNLVGDYGGAAFLAFGLLAALFEAQRSGEGQVVDAAMVDSSAHMMSMFFGLMNGGDWHAERGRNVLAGGAPFYACYRAACGGYVAVGTIEAKFFRELVERLDLPRSFVERQHDVSAWPDMREAIAAAIASRTRDEWTAAFRGAETCVTPVLGLHEAAGDEHLKARGVLLDLDGVLHPAPAPRMSRTPGAVQSLPGFAGEDTVEALLDWGCAQERISALLEEGTLATPAREGEPT